MLPPQRYLFLDLILAKEQTEKFTALLQTKTTCMGLDGSPNQQAEKPKSLKIKVECWRMIVELLLQLKIIYDI